MKLVQVLLSMWPHSKKLDLDKNLGQTSAIECDKEPSVQETEMGAVTEWC